MNLSKWPLFLLFFLSGIITLAQSETASLSGKIIDATTGETLIGASIQIVGTYKGATANLKGEFIIKDIKPGDYQIKFQFIGYETKLYNDISFAQGEAKVMAVKLKEQSESLNEVVVIGRKNEVNLELAASEISITAEDLAELNTRDVKEVLELQAGVMKTQDGLQIRGARVYETEYIVDGISAQDPLAGTGFGVDVSSSSISSIDLITGGAGAEFGGGSSGVVNTKIKEGGEKLEVSGSWQRDYFADSDIASSFNTDRAEVSLGTPIPFTKNKLTLFTNVSLFLTDEYFGSQATQLHSSLFSESDFWAPRQTNSYSNTIKLAYKLKAGTKITLTNQHSLGVNQNTRSLQIVGFDAILTPGFQYNRSLNLDNATTYTHHSNLTALNISHLISKKVGLSLSLGRLFTNLRADANGRPFRSETVDQLLDEESIITNPLAVFNPNDPSGIYFILPGDGLINNGGITPVWHDHFVQEYSVNAKVNYIPSKTHSFTAGWQNKFKEYQWVDVTRPWVGAPIALNDSVSTASISIGSSNDIWHVKPIEGGFFVQDKITYKGIIATLGFRYTYWAPGKFADDAVNDPQAPVIDQVREDYLDKTTSFAGLRWKARLLPKVNVSFPVTENNVMYFNYGHSMRLPHPRFVYAGLDPVYQDRSFLSNLGNPDLDPEVNVSYELGLKSHITKDLGLTFAAYNNNRFDYIVSRSALVKDQTGRLVSKTFYINQDYAKILGVELGLHYRFNSYLRAFGNAAYQLARGKSNSARESSLQIAQDGEVALTSENYLSFDRPWNTNLGLIFTPNKKMKNAFFNKLDGLSMYLSYQFTSGYRYTPEEKTGVNQLGRPMYESQIDKYLEAKAKDWHKVDLKVGYNIPMGKKKGNGVALSLEVRNLLDTKNSQIINAVTGQAYEYGDDVPNSWRDLRYNGPQQEGQDPRNPARYLAPRQILYGISFKF